MPTSEPGAMPISQQLKHFLT